MTNARTISYTSDEALVLHLAISEAVDTLREQVEKWGNPLTKLQLRDTERLLAKIS